MNTARLRLSIAAVAAALLASSLASTGYAVSPFLVGGVALLLALSGLVIARRAAIRRRL